MNERLQGGVQKRDHTTLLQATVMCAYAHRAPYEKSGMRITKVRGQV